VQAHNHDGLTSLHHALSLYDPSPTAAAWISAALSLPGIAKLRDIVLHDISSGPAAMNADETALELYRGDSNAAKVMLIVCQASSRKRLNALNRAH
jgi:hypothetical protein